MTSNTMRMQLNVSVVVTEDDAANWVMGQLYFQVLVDWHPINGSYQNIVI